MIRFACPICHRIFKAPDEAARRKVPCPRCGQLLVVPAPLHVKNKAMLGLLLPDSAGSPVAPVSSVESSVALQEYSSETRPPPIPEPARQRQPAVESSTGYSEPEPVRVGLLVQAPQLALDVLEVVDAQLFEPQQLPIQPEIEDVEEEEGEEEGEEKEDQVAVPHSLTGIITTVGAIALFTIIAIFFASCDTKIEKMRETPGKIAFQNVGKLQTMRRVGSFIALSSGLT